MRRQSRATDFLLDAAERLGRRAIALDADALLPELMRYSTCIFIASFVKRTDHLRQVSIIQMNVMKPKTCSPDIHGNSLSIKKVQLLYHHTEPNKSESAAVPFGSAGDVDGNVLLVRVLVNCQLKVESISRVQHTAIFWRNSSEDVTVVSVRS